MNNIIVIINLNNIIVIINMNNIIVITKRQKSQIITLSLRFSGKVFIEKVRYKHFLK